MFIYVMLSQSILTSRVTQENLKGGGLLFSFYNKLCNFNFQKYLKIMNLIWLPARVTAHIGSFIRPLIVTLCYKKWIMWFIWWAYDYLSSFMCIKSSLFFMQTKSSIINYLLIYLSKFKYKINCLCARFLNLIELLMHHLL